MSERDGKVKNAALFCLSFRFSRVQLRKPPGEILNYLTKNFEVNARIVYDEYLYPIFYRETSDVTADDRGDIELTNVGAGKKFKRTKDVLDAYRRYLDEKGKEIDLMIVFHGNLYSAEICNYYKKINPAGKIMTVLDFDPGHARRSKARAFASLVKNTIFTRMYPKLWKYIDNCDVFTAEKRKSYDWLREHGLFFKNITDKLELMPFGFDPDSMPPKQVEKENAFITVGRIGAYQKNNELILEALGDLDLEDWKFRFVGPIDDEFLPKIEEFYTVRPDLRDKVIFTGGIDNADELTDLYAKSKVFVLSSRFESFCLAIVEAASYDEYIVSTDVGVAGDVIEETGGALYKSADELKTIMEKIISSVTNIATGGGAHQGKIFLGYDRVRLSVFPYDVRKEAFAAEWRQACCEVA